MSGVNHVTLLGELGEDPISRSFGGGAGVVNLRVVTTETWVSGGEQKERRTFHRVAAFGREGQYAESLVKGDTVFVSGRINNRSYEDKDGAKKYLTEVVAEKILRFGGEASAPVPAPAQAAFDDEIPF